MYGHALICMYMCGGHKLTYGAFPYHAPSFSSFCCACGEKETERWTHTHLWGAGQMCVCGGWTCPCTYVGSRGDCLGSYLVTHSLRQGLTELGWPPASLRNLQDSLTTKAGAAGLCGLPWLFHMGVEDPVQAETGGFLETSLASGLKFQANERIHLKRKVKAPEHRLSFDLCLSCKPNEIEPNWKLAKRLSRCMGRLRESMEPREVWGSLVPI